MSKSAKERKRGTFHVVEQTMKFVMINPMTFSKQEMAEIRATLAVLRRVETDRHLLPIILHGVYERARAVAAKRAK